ncbi:MAG: hypothetical protein ACM3ML_21275 [Micromonosporaceae bacterium]
MLRGVGIESEAELAFAGLHQVVRPVLDRLDRLPAPQALALRSAFALSEEPIDERHGQNIGFEVMDWLLTTANGNPLALIELPASLTPQQLSGQEPLDGTLAPPTSVEQVYLERLERLPPRTRSMLLVAACEEAGERATVARAAAELGLDPDALSRRGAGPSVR